MTYRGPLVFQQAVSELSKLPGIGEKTAQRLVFYMIHTEDQFVESLSTSLRDLKSKLKLCSICMSLTDTDPCPLCQDVRRDQTLICVVEDLSDLFAIERSGQFRGVYHVLNGSLSPLDGVGPDQLKIAELLRRVESQKPREIVLATNPDVEGEATALYLARIFAEKKIPVSRIALGIPMGGHLEYADHATLGHAILERRAFSVR